MSRHIDHVVSVGLGSARAVSQGPAESLFHKSWTRCMKLHGLDPTRPAPARILPSNEVRDHQQRMDGFMRVARAGMEDLYRRVCDLGYMLLLTDADGVTVDYIGNPASEERLKAAGLYLGADWNEAHAGTCGVGTCLVEQAVITCHQSEHFDATHIALTCTSAPLYAPDGQVLGVLDVSALHSPEARESQHLVRHLASMYAQLIEDANFLRSFARHPVLRLGPVPGLVEVSGDVMLALDEDGRVIGANTGARRRFGVAGGSGPVGQGLSELLEVDMDMLRGIARSAQPVPLATGLSQRLAPSYHAVVVPPRVLPASSPASSRHEERPARTAAPLDRLFGTDPAMAALIDQGRRLVDRQVNLLIRGETGSGKEVLARALHASSTRAAQPFVAVNCASIPESLIESELFGYMPGAFTGGRNKGMKGLIAQSDGGTLFLDEIGDMPLSLQTRLLRVLSESEVLPLGAERPVPVRLSVMAATHRDLREAVAAGSFREDLYYRLCGATLALPALRERADRQYLVETLFDEECERLGLASTLAPEAQQRLMAHDWPGNVRELRNALRYAVALGGGREVTVGDLPAELRAPSPVHAPAPLAAAPGEDGPDDVDAARLLQALKACRWRIAATARELHVCRATVYRQMKRHGIVPPHLQ